MDNERKKIIIGFKKAKSSLEKIIKMTEDGEYCVDIMQQNLAVIGLLKSAHHHLLDNHLNTCFKNAMASKNEGMKKKMIAEITKVNKIANK
jgi:DNA-binding FrmR family transcriptional regulator